jgi:hypothetical protein
MVTVTVRASGGGREHLIQATLQRWIIPWLRVKEFTAGLTLGIVLTSIMRKRRKAV